MPHGILHFIGLALGSAAAKAGQQEELGNEIPRAMSTQQAVRVPVTTRRGEKKGNGFGRMVAPRRAFQDAKRTRRIADLEQVTPPRADGTNQPEAKQANIQKQRKR